MPRIPSAFDSTREINSGGRIPVLFQVVSPDGVTELLPDALFLHVNPSDLKENFTKKIEREKTRAGWIEWHWGDELDSISCSASTGTFVNTQTGLASVLRRNTIAYSKFLDLKALFHNNGSIYDDQGAIVLQGGIRIMYDTGVFTGFFTDFSIEESEDSPFAFELSWSFKTYSQVGRAYQRKLYSQPGAYRPSPAGFDQGTS
jgi:hypothetical protein